MHRRRWPLAGPRARRRPMAAAADGDGRACIKFASERFGRPWRSENRECIKSTSESAPRCADLLVSRAREAIRKIASALNLHLKRRRLAQVYASYARARRRRRCSFLPIRLAALRWSSEELRGRWPTAGRRRGKPMGLGRLLALDSEPAHWCLYPLARVARGRRGPRWIIFARCTGGAGRWRGQGLVADQRPQPRHGDGRACIEFCF